MNIYFKHLVLFFCPAFIGAVKFRCDYKYRQVGWFKYYEMPMSWHDARFQCHLQDAMLASPTTKTIENIMMDIMGTVDVFTGIHATISKGHYYSIDGIPLAEIPHTWADSEPDNKNNAECCLTLNSDGKMADVKCDEPRPYICFREKSSKDVTICGSTDTEYHFDSRTNKCYKFHTNPQPFHRAHFTCSAEGGHLAIINSDEESKVIIDIYAKYPDEKILGFFRTDIAFIGFYNWGESMDWRTIHGQTIQDAGFAKFAGGEPNNVTGGEGCGSVTRNGLLNDLACESYYPFFCEKKPSVLAVCDTSDK